ncbi:PRC-barrel domain-containing protein [Acidisphaera rubrifaciens]|uniref:PRC-barrel protein n=1 Tax=Acidisphaera rubrifaciens HS-AP3 TaxID=1231350 RepID=A0A0D6PAI1_9PROT|nr:PRC-barrel domain-containing protein [Acidisphaera rubrifaciens]GAN78203.1 PRC-barrel protein [Acidisphaera rubrifaciens HS-AP3]
MKMIPAGETMPILGHDVDGPDGQNIGKLVDVLVDAGGVPRAAVLDVGGFLGVGNRVVSVEWDALHFHLRSADHAIVTTLTPDQIRAAPEYKDPGQAAPVVVAPRHR